VEQALAVVESALAELREMDGETRSVVRWVAAAELGPRAGSPDSPLWAFPILLKDNIETAECRRRRARWRCATMRRAGMRRW
jgi:Asp-tRNA(Asn)/Glu-tRNA(Gln) amidotransferase A subunit family amidase